MDSDKTVLPYTEAQINAAAEAIYKTFGGQTHPWEKTGEWVRENYRDAARAALRATEQPKDALVGGTDGPLIVRVAKRIHEAYCDRANCDEHCQGDYKYETANEVTALVRAQQAEGRTTIDAKMVVRANEALARWFGGFDNATAVLRTGAARLGTDCMREVLEAALYDA